MAIATDWVVDETFCHRLYRNMPYGMLDYMVQELPNDDGSGGVDSGKYIILDTCSSLAMRVLSHVLGTLGHPVLAYLFYKLQHQHSSSLLDSSYGKNSSSSECSSLWKDNVLTWPIIIRHGIYHKVGALSI